MNESANRKPAFSKILVVCQANICRSPMAEALLRNMNPNIQCDSAGIMALAGYPADLKIQEWMLQQGIDISAHRAKQMTPALLMENDLILVMDKKQEKEVVYTLPQICGKVHRLGKWGDFDIPDPYRRSQQTVELVFNLITQGLQEWQKKFN